MIDRQQGQPRRLVVWCEAAGMAPQLQAICAPYSVPVFSSGGFDSVTAKHNIAHEFASLGSVVVLHIGDHDPSGVHVFGALDEDVSAFLLELGGVAEFVRLAVLPEHIKAFHLPTAPPKATDRRNFHGATVQAEALPPDQLAATVQQAIEARFDQQAYHQASLRSRERFWDIRVPKIDSIFDNSLVPRSSWSPGVPPQHRKLVAATHRSPI